MDGSRGDLNYQLPSAGHGPLGLTKTHALRAAKTV